jgi:hypothetical protein
LAVFLFEDYWFYIIIKKEKAGGKFMKKYFIIFIFCFIVWLSPQYFLFSQEAGDVNNDTFIDIVDALLVARYYVGLNPSPFYSLYADVNGDTAVDILDALMIAQYYVGLIQEFPSVTPTPAMTTQAPTGPPASTPGSGAWTGAFLLQYRCLDTNGSTTTLKPSFQIFNIGESDTSLSELKIRYWYTKEGTADETWSIGYAVVGTENVTVSFADAGQHHYAEIGFTAGAGNVGSGNITGAVNVTIKHPDNALYDQSNDYSYNPSLTAFSGCFPVREADIGWELVTLYWKDLHIWGTEPDGTTPPPCPGPTACRMIFLFS